MAIENGKFEQLCARFAAINPCGDGPPAPPWNNVTTANVNQAIDTGTSALPVLYQIHYAAPVVQHLDSIIKRAPDTVETLASAVYEHAPDTKDDQIRRSLQRFLAVVSNLYRSFLSDVKRSGLQIPQASVGLPQAPPLATFAHKGTIGPFTITSDEVAQLCGAQIGVVSLPSSFRDAPVLWASLAHETGGHDVLHADQGLLPELAGGVRSLFGGGSLAAGQEPNISQLQGLLWSYWIEEAAADVYGLLNMGPSFMVNTAALLAAVDTKLSHTAIPMVLTESGHSQNDPALDSHPTEILRLHLAIGAIENLTGLSLATRAQYIADLEMLAGICGGGALRVVLDGNIEVDRDRWVPVHNSWPMQDLQAAARQVGAYIVTTRLTALGNHSIQDVETWDDADEHVAQSIATALAGNNAVSDMGDDAQLLAGATLALAAQPDLYDQVTQLLSDALDRSFQQDPIWGAPTPHPMFVRNQIVRPMKPEVHLPSETPVEGAPREGAATELSLGTD